ncbi:MAG: hypothetical protein JNL62_20850 [Bryobacterales bacterium]|nr:hypothetical protein [Bryobacterales bacterium]
MTLGAEPKKVAALGGLMLLAAYSFYSNVLSGPDVPEGAKQSARPAAGVAPVAAPVTPAAKETARRTEERKMLMGKQSVGDYHPVFKATNEKERPDPMKVDPTLRMDLVARLQNVTLSGGQRSLFEISNLPEPVATAGKDPTIPVDPKKTLLYARLARAMGPDPKPVPPTPTPKPPPPPIPLKFYGYSTPQTGAKRAFFLEGEEIHVIKEGDLVKKRYRIVKIGLKSVVVEDVEHKHEQTMPLEEPPSNG